MISAHQTTRKLKKDSPFNEKATLSKFEGQTRTFSPPTVHTESRTRVSRSEGYGRLLPCRTHISTGSCPFKDRCTFLHDGRVVNFEVSSKTRRRCIEVASTPQEKDIFYWPMMCCGTNKDKHGDSGEQSLNNQYQTRIPSKDYMTFADFTVYSMWNSFVSFTQNLNDENQSLLSELDAPKDENPEESLLNIASNMHRLPAFIELASRQLTFGSQSVVL